jgi:hypothetical protein
MELIFKTSRLATLAAIATVSFIACHAQNPVFLPAVDIDQTKLLQSCPVATDKGCYYSLKDVLNSGGDFWTTPFQPYDSTTQPPTGDGYGEGPMGPRAAQRKAFNPNKLSKNYPYLRLNGLDSQSCFECHNSTGSHAIDKRGALIRKPYGVAGSAGSNSNAFINPFYPILQTLFIRNPPAVFGSGYQQAVGDEMTYELFCERDAARTTAKSTPGKTVTAPLTAKGIAFGTFKTTFTNGPAKVVADTSTCPASANPTYIGGIQGYTDDVTGVEGVSCDLVIRPMQWKGVASSLRHFVRDALDFHFSMQAFEKVAQCDCDRDGKGTPATGPEVSIGQLSAMVSFVGMTRPPIQMPLTSPSEHKGQQIFTGDPSIPGLYKNMCAQCHVGPLKLVTPQLLVEWPTNAADESAPPIDPDNSKTWPISPASCLKGIPSAANICPVESSYGASMTSASSRFKNTGALVSPSISSESLSVVRRYEINKAASATEANALVEALPGTSQMETRIKRLRAPLSGGSTGLVNANALAQAPGSVVGRDYVIPLSVQASDVTANQLPRLPDNPDGSINVPLLSDLKRHNMGTALSDPVGKLPSGSPIPTQGTDVNNIVNAAQQYMTRPIWGVADTGPWLHDGRALTLRDAILLHGDSATGGGSEAAPVIDAFEKLPPADQQSLVDFLLTLRLPPPGNVEPVEP